MLLNAPRIILSGLKGGSGKTVLSLGLAASWREKGLQVAPFKKGPDFIDAGWLALAAGRSCHNLDPFMMNEIQILRSFFSRSRAADICLIEGNRGLFDGLDREGCCSTAELGRLLQCPIIIIVDVTMTTRTAAALVMGCQKFEPGLKIAGVVLNRVAGSRQEALVRNSIEHYCNVPVLGAVPKLKEGYFPERHMGLVPHQESGQAERAIAWARGIVEENLDLEALEEISKGAGPLDMDAPGPEEEPLVPPGEEAVRVGFIRDRSFWFYYPENLEQIRSLGAGLLELNAMEDRDMPDLDALYIGGGFPETQAPILAGNRSFRAALKGQIEKGLPVYAECGGLMFLGEELRVGENRYPMAGVLPVTFFLEKKPQGHGYTVLEVTDKNPYFPIGETLRGHEFHYSRPVINEPGDLRTVFRVLRGHGMDGRRDGLCRKNVLATYTHLHSAGNPFWGRRFIQNALYLRKSKKEFFLADSKKRD